MERQFLYSRFLDPLWPPVLGGIFFSVGLLASLQFWYTWVKWLVFGLACLAAVIFSMLSTRDWRLAKRGGVLLTEEQVTIFDGVSSVTDSFSRQSIVGLRVGVPLHNLSTRKSAYSWYELVTSDGTAFFLALQTDDLLDVLRVWIAQNVGKGPISEENSFWCRVRIHGKGFWFTPPLGSAVAIAATWILVELILLTKFLVR